jgi:hypothetical protein
MCKRIGEKRYKVLVGNLEGNRPLGRHRSTWEDGIKVHLEEICWRGVEWIQLVQDVVWLRAVVNAVMNDQVRAPRS